MWWARPEEAAGLRAVDTVVSEHTEETLSQKEWEAQLLLVRAWAVLGASAQGESQAV